MKDLQDILLKGLKSEDRYATLDSVLDSIINDNNLFAKFLAIYVRNNMEDFHVEHLSDDQMRELNPIIRNSIFTALEDMSNQKHKTIFNIMLVPKYWEDCEYISGQSSSSE